MVRRQKPRVVRQVQLYERMQRLTSEVEALVPLLRSAPGNDGTFGPLLVSASRALERAAKAVRAVAGDGRPSLPGDVLPAGFVTGILEDTSQLMSLLGSRVVLARTGERAPASTPSIGALALAIL